MWTEGCDRGQRSGACVCATGDVEVLQVAVLQGAIHWTQGPRAVVNTSTVKPVLNGPFIKRKYFQVP
jgi:hypothetical protein